MSMSFEAPHVEISERVRALARRMLGGAAAASIDAYRTGEQLACVAHCVTDDGALLVAAVPTGELALMAPGVGVDVRLDAIKHTPDPSISLVAASIHLLGVLSWVDDVTLESRRAEGLPPLVGALLDSPGARLGVIDMERAVLHDMTGATAFGPEILQIVPGPQQDGYLGFELVAAYGQDVLKDLCWAVLVDEVPGEAVTKGPLPGVCAHTADRVYCVDVDPLGVTLMLVGQGETVVAFAAFGEPADSDDAMVRAVCELMFEVSAAAVA